MTPGEYIRRRREAARMSIGDVLAVLAGGATLSAPIEDLESGRAMPAGMDVALLSFAFPIDDMIALALREGESVQICRDCACSLDVPCMDRRGSTCIRLETDLCSHCCPVETYLRQAAEDRAAIATHGLAQPEASKQAA